MDLLNRLCEEEKIDIDHGILQQLINKLTDITNRERAEYAKLLFQRPIYMESESMLDNCNSMTRRNKWIFPFWKALVG